MNLTRTEIAKTIRIHRILIGAYAFGAISAGYAVVRDHLTVSEIAIGLPISGLLIYGSYSEIRRLRAKVRETPS